MTARKRPLDYVGLRHSATRLEVIGKRLRSREFIMKRREEFEKKNTPWNNEREAIISMIQDLENNGINKYWADQVAKAIYKDKKDSGTIVGKIIEDKLLSLKRTEKNILVKNRRAEKKDRARQLQYARVKVKVLRGLMEKLEFRRFVPDLSENMLRDMTKNSYAFKIESKRMSTVEAKKLLDEVVMEAKKQLGVSR